MKKIKNLSPIIKIVMFFALIIVIGGLLFKLPISVKSGYYLGWVDSFFLSTSSVCITGLLPITSAGQVLSGFGQALLAILIQIGGIGFVTLGVFVLVTFGAKINISQRSLIKESFNQNSSQGMVKLVLKVITITGILQFIGAVINFFIFLKKFSFWENIKFSIFHSISSFNNAGFEIFGFEGGLEIFSNNIWFNLNTCFLALVGGLGFIVIYDIISARKFKDLSIHTRIVLRMTFILVIIGALFFKLSQNASMDNYTWLNAFFQSIACRTSGFSTIKTNQLNQFSIMIVFCLMFIGASPCSTGGGIKTTTFYVIVKSIFSFSIGKKTLVYNREIASETKLKAFIVFSIATITVITFSLLILAFESFNPNTSLTIQDVLFECVSTFGTVGFSFITTSKLHALSKITLCFLMFIGRLGTLTMLSLWNKNLNKPKDNLVNYIEEKMIIG